MHGGCGGGGENGTTALKTVGEEKTEMAPFPAAKENQLPNFLPLDYSRDPHEVEAFCRIRVIHRRPFLPQLCN